MLGGILKVLGYLPAILTGIEGLFGPKSGAQKQTAALSLVGFMFQGIEGISGKDIVDNEEFQTGLKKVIEGTVQCMNASIWKKS